MKLSNFELSSSIELTGLGQVWDLHNCADFAGLELLPEKNALRLTWIVPNDGNEQGKGFSGFNPARSCAIRFDDVTGLWLTRTRHELSPSDARTIDAVAFVLPLEQTPEGAIRAGLRAQASPEQGNLRFSFMSGFDIEIAAASATLEAEL